MSNRRHMLGLALLAFLMPFFLGWGCKSDSTNPPAPVTPVTPPAPVTPVTPPTPDTSRKAVLVGINNYPGAQLNGCVNDVLDIAALIKARYSYTDTDIRLITDAKATTAAITDALNWLVQGAKPGDFRLFWYSGHGAEYAGSDVSQQPDGKNQVICPVDFDWSEPHMIMDVQFNKLFAQMPTGVLFNWGSDSCHSGDLTKVVPPKNVKWKKYPITPPNIATQLKKVTALSIKKSRAITGGELDVGYLSGCTYDQYSADTSDATGRPCGAMTNAFKTVIVQSGVSTQSLSDVGALVDKALPSDQQPQVEGSRKTKPFQLP